ncbi:MAG: helix-turn-helix transcriptional regulator [Micrococcales bacterium]|nr:helix-turn-helix transcriptional regulator [Micrococcales bacterium]MCL2667222.1 helix-turn-helix transcriptional regulator [Micrococcales bacterium]
MTQAAGRTQAYIDAHRLAGRRARLGLTQSDVAERMGVTKNRISQIERGDVSTVDVARYVAALGGQLQVAAVFGDDQLVLRSATPDAA